MTVCMAAHRARGAPSRAGAARGARGTRRRADASGDAPRDARGRLHGADGTEVARWLSAPQRIRVRGPLTELTLARIRELTREPEAVFWVFVFPILLAAILGLAFRSRPPEALPVAWWQGRTPTRVWRRFRASPT